MVQVFNISRHIGGAAKGYSLLFWSFFSESWHLMPWDVEMVRRGGWSNVMHLIGLRIKDIDALVGIVTFTMKPAYMYLITLENCIIYWYIQKASEKFAENVRTSWRLIAQQKYIIFLVDNISYLSKKYHFVCAIWRNWAMLTLHTVQNWWFLRSSPKFFWKSNMIRGFWIPAKPVFWMYESIL